MSDYLGMFFGMAKNLTPKDKQAILQSLTRLSAQASTGYVFGVADAKGFTFELRGIVGSGIWPMMGGAAVGGAISAGARPLAPGDDQTGKPKSDTPEF